MALERETCYSRMHGAISTATAERAASAWGAALADYHRYGACTAGRGAKGEGFDEQILRVELLCLVGDSRAVSQSL